MSKTQIKKEQLEIKIIKERISKKLERLNKTLKRFEIEYMPKFETFLEEVRVMETYQKMPQQSKALWVILSEAIYFWPQSDKEWLQVPHSFPLLLNCYLWKAVEWIIYEILNGRYFEAMRDIRFLFEGTIWGLILEEVIESKVYERYKTLSDIDFKLGIIEIWEECKYGKHSIKPDMKEEEKKERLEKSINRFIRKLKYKSLSEKVKEDYFNILLDSRLWLSTFSAINIMVEKLEKEFSFKGSKKILIKLHNTWKVLSSYTHFPGVFFHKIRRDVKYVFLEKFNKELFKDAFESFFTTLDLLYAVSLWRWPSEKKKQQIKEALKFWGKNFGKNFSEQYFEITNSIFKKYAKVQS